MSQTDPLRQQYEHWVSQYAPELYRYARGLTADAGRAEDLLQDTFTEAWSSLASLREPEKVRAWLFQIMRFRFFRSLRHPQPDRGAAPLTDQLDDYPANETLSPLDNMALRESLQTSLEKLSPELRRTFLMVFLEGLTCRETALALGIPLGTVLSRLTTARRSLQRMMDHSGEVSAGAALRRPRPAPPPP